MIVKKRMNTKSKTENTEFDEPRQAFHVPVTASCNWARSKTGLKIKLTAPSSQLQQDSIIHRTTKDRKSYELLELSLTPLAGTGEVTPSQVNKSNDKYLSNFGQQLFNKDEIAKSHDAVISALDLITLNDDDNDSFIQSNDIIG